MKKENIIELAGKAYTLGKEYEKTYRGCGQCVIAALQDALGIRNDDIFKSATGLAGGTGLAGDSGCGAYIGAILVLSSLLGRERNNFSDPEGIRHKTHQLTRKFRENLFKNMAQSSATISKIKFWVDITIFPTPRSMKNSTMPEPTISIALRSWVRQPNG